jgi:hypothetical protein
MRNYDNNIAVNEEINQVSYPLRDPEPTSIPRMDQDIKDCQEYVRPRMDYLREHEISIRFLSLGCIVRVGCKEIAFTSIEDAMKEINTYVANPKASTDRFNQLFNEQK